MGNSLISQSESGSCSATESCDDLIIRHQGVTQEDIYKVLLEAYQIITSEESFEHRLKALTSLNNKYRCLYNPYFIYRFQPERDGLGFESYLFLATVGSYAIDFMVYWDTVAWVVLNTNRCIRNYKPCLPITNGSVAKRKCYLDEEQRCLYQKTVQEVDCIFNTCNFYQGPATLVDFRTKPKCRIECPKSKAKVGRYFTLRMQFKNWSLDGDRHYKVYLDGNLIQVVYSESCDIDLKGYANGWHKLRVALFDKKDNDIGIGCQHSIKLKWDDSSSSSSTKSSSSSSSTCSSTSSTPSSTTSNLIHYLYEPTYSSEVSDSSFDCKCK